jgi:cytochrome P450
MVTINLGATTLAPERAAALAAMLPTVHWMPLLPPHRDDPPYQQMLDHDISWCPELSTVLIAGYHSVRAALINPDTFTSTTPSRLTIATTPAVRRKLAGLPIEPPLIVNSDGPTHRRLRTVLHQSFTRWRVATRGPRMRDWANHLVDRLQPIGRAELDTQFAGPFLARSTNDMFGFPAADDDLIERFCWATNVLLAHTDPERDQLEAANAYQHALRYLTRLTEHRQHQRPEPERDVLYDLTHSHEHARLTDAEIFYHALVTRVAADTTRYLLTSAVQDLLRSGLWTHARAHTASEQRTRFINQAIDEVLRRRSPHGALTRHTRRPTTLAHHDLPAGTPVTLVLAAANLDPAAFAHPAVIDLGRRGSAHSHLAFGLGPHHCVGATLARTQTRIAIEALLRLPNLQLAQPDRREQHAHPIFNGPQRVELTWNTAGSRP